MESHHLLQHPHMHFPPSPFTPKLTSSLLNLKPHKPHLFFYSLSHQLIKTPSTKPTINIDVNNELDVNGDINGAGSGGGGFHCVDVSDGLVVLKTPTTNSRKPSNGISKAATETLKQSWLSSLSWVDISGDVDDDINGGGGRGGGGSGSHCVIGVDPDVSGALAIVKPEVSGFSAQVFDSPYVQVSVGKTRRKRLDARSIVQLVRSIDAPKGTIAYLEQSIPYPQDGKQGWWSGGFGYGLWIGILVASGFSVVPVPSSVWKKEFRLVRSRSSKDDSRELAAKLFPDLSPMLKRKKDHGRAEALLIAAYGKGLNPRFDESHESKTPVEL